MAVKFFCETPYPGGDGLQDFSEDSAEDITSKKHTSRYDILTTGRKPFRPNACRFDIRWGPTGWRTRNKLLGILVGGTKSILRTRGVSLR